MTILRGLVSASVGTAQESASELSISGPAMGPGFGGESIKQPAPCSTSLRACSGNKCCASWTKVYLATGTDEQVRAAGQDRC